MRVSGFNIRKTELFMIIVFALGCILDHATTYYGLSLLTFIESNSIVRLLIEYDVWHLIEILILISGVSSCLIASSSKSRFTLLFSMATLMTVGLIRLYAGIHNLILITNVLTL